MESRGRIGNQFFIFKYNNYGREQETKEGRWP